MIETEAWVLHRGTAGHAGELVREAFAFPELAPDELLAAPLYGCWEGNMDHAIRRSPIDVCALRDEPRIVLGNAGVVRVLRTGAAVTTARPGDVGLLFCNGTPDRHGYPIKILGYDAPGTMGVLCKQMKLHERQFIPVPVDGPFSLPQWAAFSLRYITAWANWRVALGCWRTQMTDAVPGEALVCGWGGGVSLAELALARDAGFRTAMVASRPSRLALLRTHGIAAIDRSGFTDATFEPEMLRAIDALSDSQGAAIFIDNIGAHYRLTLKAMARQGVIATSGWKRNTTFPTMRSMECIARHLHVFTHYARYSEGVEAVRYALEHDWMAPPVEHIYAWDDIPQLVHDYASDAIDSYFPIFAINGPVEGATKDLP